MDGDLSTNGAGVGTRPRIPGAATASLFGVMLLPLTACSVGEPPEPSEGTFAWIAYTNETVGFAMEIPDVYRPDEEAEGRAVLFRSDDGVPVKVYWMTGEEGEGSGLWFGETPTGTGKLSGREASRYEYTHCDGPLCSRIISFVLPHRGRHLALEFRSDGPLNATNRRILEAFRVTQTEARAGAGT